VLAVSAHRWKNSGLFTVSYRPDQPHTATNAKITSGEMPSVMRKNCSTSLKIEDESPPRTTYAITIIIAAERKMLAVIDYPSSSLNTIAIAYMLRPMSRIMKMANKIALNPRVASL
jgi:hypothetical protein